MSRDAWTPTPERLILLRRNLTDYFSDDELRGLCSEIGVDYEHLRGPGKAAKASELVRHLAARGRIPELVVHASRLRPNAPWGDLLQELAAETDSLREPPVPSTGTGPTFRRLGWFVAGLIVVVGLLFALSGGLRLSTPETPPSRPPSTPSPVPTASPPTTPTPTPAVAAMTATPQWTRVPPTETSALPPPTVETPEPTPAGTPTPTAWVSSTVSRTVTLLAPTNGACTQSPVITFKWTGAALRPGESFLVGIVPSEVNKGECSSNYDRGITSPPLMGYEWTTDISVPPDVAAACAGLAEWTVYIKSAAGNVAQAAPTQYFEWNPLRCRK